MCIHSSMFSEHFTFLLRIFCSDICLGLYSIEDMTIAGYMQERVFPSLVVKVPSKECLNRARECSKSPCNFSRFHLGMVHKQS